MKVFLTGADSTKCGDYGQDANMLDLRRCSRSTPNHCRAEAEMSIGQAEIAKIAELAKIRIADREIGEVTSRIARILAMVEQMQAVDTSGLEPMAHPLDASQRLRPDVVTETDQREYFQPLAPELEDDLYLVPRVID